MNCGPRKHRLCVHVITRSFVATITHLHCRTASILLGRTVTKEDKTNRSLAKATNFGLLSGQSAAGLKDYAKNAYGFAIPTRKRFNFAMPSLTNTKDSRLGMRAPEPPRTTLVSLRSALTGLGTGSTLRMQSIGGRGSPA